MLFVMYIQSFEGEINSPIFLMAMEIQMITIPINQAFDAINWLTSTNILLWNQLSFDMHHALHINIRQRIEPTIKKQASKPRSYASSKLRPTDWLTHLLTWVKCRATRVAKNQCTYVG